MSSESTDSDLGSDWTVVSSTEENEVSHDNENDNQQSISNVNKSENSNESKVGSSTKIDSEIEEINMTKKASPAVDDDEDPLPRSDSSLSSDVDVIDESLDEHLESALPAFIPESTLFSFVCPSAVVSEHPSTSSRNLDAPVQAPQISQSTDHTNPPPVHVHGTDSQNRTSAAEDSVSTLGTLGAIMIIMLISFAPYLKSAMKITDPGGTAKALRNIQNEILICIGSQQIDAIKNSDSEMLYLEVCADKSIKWKDKLERSLGYRDAISFLSAAQKDFSAHSEKETVWTLSSEEKNAFKGLKVDLIIRQLTYSGLLPFETKQIVAESEITELEDNKKDRSAFNKLSELENSIALLRQVVENLTIENQELKTQIRLNNEEKETFQLIKSEVRDLKRENAQLEETLQNIISKFKNRASTHTVEFDTVITDPNNDDTGHYNNKINELKEGINNLLFENDDLKREIVHLRYGHTVQVPYYEKEREFHDDSSKDTKRSAVNIDLNEPNEKTDSYKMNNVDNINLKGFDFIAVLTKQIEKVHSSLTAELMEVKKWNELMQNIAKKVKHDSSQDYNNWSWHDIKKNVHDILLEAQNDVTEKMNSFQKMNVTEMINNYITDNKKNVESVLNLFGHYFKAAQEKTQEIFEKKLPEIDTESTVNSMWNVFGKLKEKWSYVKAEFQKMTKKVKPKTSKIKKTEYKANSNQPRDQNDDVIIDEYEHEEEDKMMWKKHKVNNQPSDQNDDVIIDEYEHEEEDKIIWKKHKVNNQPSDPNDAIIIDDYENEERNEIIWKKYKTDHKQLLDQDDAIIIDDYEHEYDILKEQPVEVDRSNWYFKHAEKPTYDRDLSGNKIKPEKVASEADWLFERAAYREKHRRNVEDLPPNWFLLKHIRRMMDRDEIREMEFIKEQNMHYPNRKMQTHNRRNSNRKQDNAWSGVHKDNHYR